MIGSKLTKAIILGVCIAMFSAGAVSANPDDSQMSIVQVRGSGIDSELLDKQSEIDRYVFEEHRDEIEQKGITVTHTGPMDNYVEIGITPYTEENAEFLYKAFGKEKVKVVEGQQAEIMNLGVGVESGNNAELYAANSAPIDANKASGMSLTVVILIGGFLAVAVGSFVVLSRKRRLAGR